MRILTFLQNSLHCGSAHSGELERPAELSAQTGPVSTEATVGWSCLEHSRTARDSGIVGAWQRQLVVPWGLWLPVSTSSMLWSIQLYWFIWAVALSGLFHMLF